MIRRGKPAAAANLFGPDERAPMFLEALVLHLEASSAAEHIDAVPGLREWWDDRRLDVLRDCVRNRLNPTDSAP